MSQETSRLNLPFIQPAQAQKHVTHNEALQILDVVIQLSIIEQRSAPPDISFESDAYIIHEPNEGLWAGRDHQIAVWQDENWRYLIPQDGWLCWDKKMQEFLVYSDAAWTILQSQAEASAAPQTLPLLGVNATADDNNKLNVRSENSLFDNIGGAHRLKINKSGASETASILFQDNYQSYAEIGLLGDRQLRLKINKTDGGWADIFYVSADTGVIHVEKPIEYQGRRAFDSEYAPDVLHLKGSLASNKNLNSFVTTGMWHQSSNVRAASGQNYPVGFAGLLTVVATSAMVYQTYQVYNGGSSANKTFQRGRYRTSWSKWREL